MKRSPEYTNWAQKRASRYRSRPPRFTCCVHRSKKNRNCCPSPTASTRPSPKQRMSVVMWKTQGVTWKRTVKSYHRKRSNCPQPTSTSVCLWRIGGNRGEPSGAKATTRATSVTNALSFSAPSKSTCACTYLSPPSSEKPKCHKLHHVTKTTAHDS